MLPGTPPPAIVLFLSLLIFLSAPAIAEIHDLAAIGIVAPKTVTLAPTSPQLLKPITVVIQNRGPLEETIPDAATLAQLVTLQGQTLGTCPDLLPVLVPPRKFPIKLKSKAKLNVVFNVLFNCANDRAATTTEAPHHDFQYAAAVHRTALDGLPDDHPADDVCPHDALPGNLDPYPDGTIVDKGAGTKKADGTFGGPLFTDVVLSGPDLNGIKIRRVWDGFTWAGGVKNGK